MRLRDLGAHTFDVVPANWTLPLVHGDWQRLTEMFASTIIGVLAFSENLPIEVTAFGADRPCCTCTWPDRLEPDDDATRRG